MNANFAGKHVIILGLARQGLALARFFVATGARVTVSDAAPAERLAGEIAALGDLPVELALGGHPLELLDDADLLCLSGGVPSQIDFVQAALRRRIPLSNDSLLTLQLARARGLGPVVAITGSSGKTTTTTLVGKMLAAAGRPVHVGGNIGTPLIDRLDAIAPGDCMVLELSSFQLEWFDPAVAWGSFMELGPAVAAILNITPNHLDRHPNMAAYAMAKLNLLRFMRRGSTAVLNADNAITGSLLGHEADPESAPQLAAWKLGGPTAETRRQLAEAGVAAVPFSCERRLEHGAWLEGQTLMYEGQAICRRDELRLRGDHNLSNVLAAAAISGAAGATVAAMGETARSFTGVTHRLEVVGEVGGVVWINDSIATSPERAIAGLRCFGRDGGTLILLAGGKDKHLPWDTFADEVLDRVDLLIGFGQAGPMIVETVQEQARFLQRRPPNSAVTQRLDEAVVLAARAAGPGTVVLLSPGGTSYDTYRDFEERGEHFRRLVRQIEDPRVVGEAGL